LDGAQAYQAQPAVLQAPKSVIDVHATAVLHPWYPGHTWQMSAPWFWHGLDGAQSYQAQPAASHAFQSVIDEHAAAVLHPWYPGHTWQMSAPWSWHGLEGEQSYQAQPEVVVHVVKSAVDVHWLTGWQLVPWHCWPESHACRVHCCVEDCPGATQRYCAEGSPCLHAVPPRATPLSQVVAPPPP
jgi:hypothetical protein